MEVAEGREMARERRRKSSRCAALACTHFPVHPESAANVIMWGEKFAGSAFLLRCWTSAHSLFLLHNAAVLFSFSSLTTCLCIALQERVVQVSRVTKVVKGGKSMSFR